MRYRHWLYIATGLFVAGFIWGALSPMNQPGVLAEDLAALEELADLFSPLPQAAVFVFIFAKNISVVVISLVLSPLFCLTPILALVVNGGILGLVSVLVTEQSSLGLLLAGLLPHGIFEIPAFIMAEAVALSLGLAVMQGVFNRGKRNRLLPLLQQSSRKLQVVVVLLLIAAAAETYLTPMFIQ